MRAVSPSTGAPEHIVAEEQEQYLPLPVAFYVHPDETRSLVTAWVPSSEELHALARDLYARLRDVPLLVSEAHTRKLLADLFKANPIMVTQLNFGTPMTPMRVSVGREEWMLAGEAQGDGS